MRSVKTQHQLLHCLWVGQVLAQQHEQGLGCVSCNWTFLVSSTLYTCVLSKRAILLLSQTLLIPITYIVCDFGYFPVRKACIMQVIPEERQVSFGLYHLYLQLQHHIAQRLSGAVLCRAGGTTGMILTSLFSTLTANSAGVDGAFYGNGLQLGKTLAVCCCLIPWICIFTWGCLWVTDMILTLRCSGESTAT